MPELPQKKVGLVLCSGEELAEGTVTRQAGLKVLHELRPGSTITICLPLFLAGGEGDRAFARFYPTIALDGCEKRCAARATELHSGKPAASYLVSELVDPDLGAIKGTRRLNQAGEAAVDMVAERVAGEVDRLLGTPWSRRTGAAADQEATGDEAALSGCSCGVSLPVQTIHVEGESVTLTGLPLLLEQYRLSGRLPGPDSARDLLRDVAIYNQLPGHSEESYLRALELAYAAFLEEAIRTVNG